MKTNMKRIASVYNNNNKGKRSVLMKRKIYLPLLFCMFSWLLLQVHAIQSINYYGTLNQTVLGDICQPWKLKTPHDHNYNNEPENYCRDPSNSGYLWCYTMNPHIRWDLCDPRALTEKPPYPSILTNNTGSACIRAHCCNLALKKFKIQHKYCEPIYFVKRVFFHRTEKSANSVAFERKYVVSNYFTVTANSTTRSELDCALQCLNDNLCNGFIASDLATEPDKKFCELGKFNDPLGLKTLSKPPKT